MLPEADLQALPLGQVVAHVVAVGGELQGQSGLGRRGGMVELLAVVLLRAQQQVQLAATQVHLRFGEHPVVPDALVQRADGVGV